MSFTIKYKEDSFRGAVAITPSDSADLTDPVSGLYIGGAGNVTVDLASGETNVAFTAVPVGTLLPICVTKVYSTGTTATNIVGVK